MDNLKTIAGIFKMLGDETRLKILFALLEEPKTVTELVTATNLTQSHISHNLSLLRLHNIVSSQKNGKEVLNSIFDEHIVSILQDTANHIAE